MTQSTTPEVDMIAEPPSNTIKRNLFVRIVIACLWFIPIYIAGNMLVGAIVGGIAGASTQSYAAGHAAGAAAAVQFFQKYGMYIFGLEVGVTVALSLRGILPGTAKFKKP
jgi:hypothetical protein